MMGRVLQQRPAKVEATLPAYAGMPPAGGCGVKAVFQRKECNAQMMSPPVEVPSRKEEFKCCRLSGFQGNQLDLSMR